MQTEVKVVPPSIPSGSSSLRKGRKLGRRSLNQASSRISSLNHSPTCVLVSLALRKMKLFWKWMPASGSDVARRESSCHVFVS